MSNRREFTDKQKLSMWDRASGHCENCKRKIVGKLRPIYDHIVPDAVADKSKPLTIEDGQCLCNECSDHKTFVQYGGPASRGDVTEIAKTVRIVKTRAGLRKTKRPFPKRVQPWGRPLE